jgi:gliding motility-associated-like protein
MQKLVLTLVLLYSACCCYGQRFIQHQHIVLPDSAEFHMPHVADFNNDGLLDLIVLAKTSGLDVMVIFENDTTTGFHTALVNTTGLSCTSYVVRDIDADNSIDIIFSGVNNDTSRTTIYRNEGNFTFNDNDVLPYSASSISTADIDNNGSNELLLSGIDSGPFVRIFSRNQNGWEMANDSIRLHAQSIEAFDFDMDSDIDLFMSGEDESGNLQSNFYYNQKQFSFKTVKAADVRGKSSCSDLNHDGFLDIFLVGAAQSSELSGLMILNSKNGFVVKDSLPGLSSNKMFTGDFNSDGKCDINLSAKVSANDSIDLIYYANGTYDTLANSHHHTFGDADADGDLDLFQIITSPGNSRLNVLRNTTSAKNNSPTKPASPFAAFIYNRLFMYWDRAIDDHTDSRSLTYDVSVQSTQQDIMTGNFDAINGKRLVVHHGEQGLRNYILIRSEYSNTLNFKIQAIDNAYHAGNSGICSGSVAPCSEISMTEVLACKNEAIMLTADAASQWFSFDRGFINQGSTFDFTATKNDTIFVITPNQPCSTAIKVYTIHVPSEIKKVTWETRYVCEQSSHTLTAESKWSDVTWRSETSGFISNAKTITVTIDQADTIQAKLSDDSGCHLERNIIFKISKPQVGSDETYQIMKGQEVQIDAGMDAMSYLWSPVQGLSQSTIRNPIASPLATTRYMVEAADSIGCVNRREVLIVVESTAFVPNLFTPNSDGQNDVLKVYGLGDVRNFSFTVYNREGNQVFSTHSVSEVTNMGWNGSRHGVAQPAGLYFWKVKGEFDNGSRILLNGKQEGSIVLIR